MIVLFTILNHLITELIKCNKFRSSFQTEKKRLIFFNNEQINATGIPGDLAVLSS